MDNIFQFSVSCNGFDPKSEKKVVPIMTFLVEEESSCLGQSNTKELPKTNATLEIS